MQKCRNSKKYRGQSPPRCNDGQGCEACTWKWMGRIRAEMNRRFRLQQAEAVRQARKVGSK